MMFALKLPDTWRAQCAFVPLSPVFSRHVYLSNYNIQEHRFFDTFSTWTASAVTSIPLVLPPSAASELRPWIEELTFRLPFHRCAIIDRHTVPELTTPARSKLLF